MPFGHEGRQKRESLLAKRAIKPLDWQGILFPKRDEIPHVAPMPSEMAELATSLAMIGLGQAVIVELGDVGRHEMVDGHRSIMVYPAYAFIDSTETDDVLIRG